MNAYIEMLPAYLTIQVIILIFPIKNLMLCKVRNPHYICNITSVPNECIFQLLSIAQFKKYQETINR